MASEVQLRLESVEPFKSHEELVAESVDGCMAVFLLREIGFSADEVDLILSVGELQFRLECAAAAYLYAADQFECPKTYFTSLVMGFAKNTYPNTLDEATMLVRNRAPGIIPNFDPKMIDRNFGLYALLVSSIQLDGSDPGEPSTNQSQEQKTPSEAAA